MNTMAHLQAYHAVGYQLSDEKAAEVHAKDHEYAPVSWNHAHNSKGDTFELESEAVHAEGKLHELFS